VACWRGLLCWLLGAWLPDEREIWHAWLECKWYRREKGLQSCANQPAGACVAVRDTGHGLRPESLPHLFEPFYTTKPVAGVVVCRIRSLKARACSGVASGISWDVWSWRNAEFSLPQPSSINLSWASASCKLL
jgi:hypothetical protein